MSIYHSCRVNCALSTPVFIECHECTSVYPVSSTVVVSYVIHTTLDCTSRFSLEYTNAWLIILCWWIVTLSGLNSSPVWWVHLTLGLWPGRNSVLKWNCIDMVYAVLMARYSRDSCSCAILTNKHFVLSKTLCRTDESKHQCGQLKHTLKLVNHVDYNRFSIHVS